ncbi:MAG: hypothetical protein WDN49_11760 [Acetobacteraceae bacterium]
MSATLSHRSRVYPAHGHEPPGAPWRITIAGLCVVGIGRFACTPLIPALIAAKWFALAGYLACALRARPGAVHVRRTVPLLEYGRNAVALVLHRVFLADFVARGLHQGLLYSLGAIIGPLLAGHLADGSGVEPAQRAAAAAYGRSFLSARTERNYQPLFEIGSAVAAPWPALGDHR